MTNEVEVYFALKGDSFDPDAFTKRSGIAPTRVRRKGEPTMHVASLKFSSWEVSLGKMAGDVLFVSELVDKLVERLEGGADFIAEAVSDFSLYAVLEVVLTISTNDSVSTPALGFTPRAIAFLHKVGAEIDVDIYRGHG